MNVPSTSSWWVAGSAVDQVLHCGVVQRTLNKTRINVPSRKMYGFADHIFPLITRHARYEKLASANRFGETMKASAFSRCQLYVAFVAGSRDWPMRARSRDSHSRVGSL